ncbi:MAG: flagellar FliJ family protein [Balneolaceae bacterium]
MFRFSLEPVLKVRSHEETLRKQALSREVGRRYDMVRLREQVRSRLAEGLMEADSGRMGRIQDLQRVHAYGEEMRQKMIELDRSLETQEIRVATEQARLTDANRRRRVLENLRDRQQEAYQYEEEQQEQKGLDEVAARVMSTSL